MIRISKITLLLGLFALLLFVTAKGVWAASFSLSPSTKNVAVNESFTVSIILNTQGESTDGADAVILYDSGKLSVTAASLGDLYANKVQEDHTTAGRVTFRATSSADSSFTGSGTFATITFKAISDGNANIDFQFTAGATTDSNVAKAGQDLLTSTSGGVYTISTTSSGSGTGGGGVGGDGASSGDGGTTLPESGSINPTIFLTALGLLFLIVPLFL